MAGFGGLALSAVRGGCEPGKSYRRSDAEIAGSADGRVRRLAACQEVRRPHLAGETLLAIGRPAGLARGTMRK